MPGVSTAAERANVIVEIGGLPIRLHTGDSSFLDLLNKRYAGFISNSRRARFEFDIDLAPPGLISPEEDVSVRWDSGKWRLERGDFLAEWDPSAARGSIRQTPNPYSIDAVLRIVHTLLLAREGGFLLHSASAVRNGRAFLFAGVSGAGKTTISGLAPADVTLLTDEVSYVVKDGESYSAFGTPFAGELARSGENLRAPISTLFLLAKGTENKIEPVDAVTAARSLLESILFFASDTALANTVFQSACDFVSRVPVRRLTFVPDARVWEMIA